jgi:hypothetical protein
VKKFHRLDLKGFGVFLADLRVFYRRAFVIKILMQNPLVRLMNI